jgi:hypothetical protein
MYAKELNGHKTAAANNTASKYFDFFMISTLPFQD